MNPDELKRRLRGVIAFVPTPFTTDDRVDLEGLARQVDWLCDRGVNAVVVCGGVGEFFSLNLEEYRACVRSAAEAARKGVLLLAGIGHSTRIAAELASHAERAGVDGLMIHPFYFVQPSAQGVMNHYRILANTTGLGMMIYNTRHFVYSPALVEQLAELESIVALKDEHGDVSAFGAMRGRLGERLTWVNGMAEMMAAPYIAAGAQAFTSGIVNLVPEVSLSVWKLGSAGRWTELDQLIASRVRPLAQLRERKPGYSIAVIKEAMNMLGRPGGQVRSPLMPLTDSDVQELREILAGMGLLQSVAA